MTDSHHYYHRINANSAEPFTEAQVDDFDPDHPITFATDSSYPNNNWGLNDLDTMKCNKCDTKDNAHTTNVAVPSVDPNKAITPNDDPDQRSHNDLDEIEMYENPSKDDIQSQYHLFCSRKSQIEQSIRQIPIKHLM